MIWMRLLCWCKNKSRQISCITSHLENERVRRTLGERESAPHTWRTRECAAHLENERVRRALGERESAPHKPCQPLAQDAVEALNVARLSCAFACRSMLCYGQNLGISGPEIRVQQAALVRGGNTLPQKTTGGFAAVTDGVGNNLAGAAALGQPDPAFVLAKPDERPHFVKFQYILSLCLD